MLLSFLITVGALAAFIAFLLFSQQGDMPHWGIVTAILLGTFFLCWTCALILYLRWKDRRLMDPELLEGTVYGLVQGAEYQVMKSFIDYYQNHFHQGELLRFKERHYLPYHGGHTIIFDQRQLYLQDDENEAIIGNFAEYIRRVDQSSSKESV
jgi:hypothetical protein